MNVRAAVFTLMFVLFPASFTFARENAKSISLIVTAPESCTGQYTVELDGRRVGSGDQFLQALHEIIAKLGHDVPVVVLAEETVSMKSLSEAGADRQSWIPS